MHVESNYGIYFHRQCTCGVQQMLVESDFRASARHAEVFHRQTGLCQAEFCRCSVGSVVGDAPRKGQSVGRKSN